MGGWGFLGAPMARRKAFEPPVSANSVPTHGSGAHPHVKAQGDAGWI
jgi:hypothetical protein